MTGAPRPEALRRRSNPEWAIPCPVHQCKAQPGRPCHTPRGRALTEGSHPSRYDAWIAQAVNTAEARRDAS